VSRHMKAEGDAFRIKVVHTFKAYQSDEPYVSYLGPYGTLGTARAQRTREARYLQGATLTVERTTTNWEEVPE
jgi:hypothetical protein